MRPTTIHRDDGITRLHLDLRLVIEPYDEVTYDVRTGTLVARDPAASDDLTEDVSVEALTARLRDLLVDATRHDDVTRWRVTEVESR
jgi:sensor domain CHASE-containing protein